MAFTLALLGTDMSYYGASPVDPTYPRGETLSVIASLIDGPKTKEPHHSKDYAEYHLNDAITVVVGPDTAGKLIGNRIARGLLALLRAIARGETQINLIGFSRGAVECIIETHELQRIFDVLARNPNAAAECLNSDCKLTKAALYAQKDEMLHLIKSIQKSGVRLADVKVSMFLIDPVPGGRFFGLPTHWRDARFYELPPIVSHCEQKVMENEHSRGFKPIIPEIHDKKKTKFKLETLPGHHGTACGNFRDHRGKPVPLKGKTTVHVQELVLVQLIEFLKQHGVGFVSDLDAIPLASDTKNLLKPLLSESADPQLFANEYSRIYASILEHAAAYKHFDKTNYAVIGFEQSIKNFFGMRVVQRLIHFKGRGNHFLDIISPSLSRELYLNEEHARVDVAKKLALDLSAPLSEVIDDLVVKVVMLCNDFVTQEAKNPNPLLKLCQSPESKKAFLAGIAGLLNQLGERYLKGNLSDKEKETASQSAIDGLAFLKTAKPSALRDQIKEQMELVYSTILVAEEEQALELEADEEDIAPLDPKRVPKNKKEAYEQLIQKQLVPLTHQYLNHLIAEAAKMKPSLKGKQFRAFKNTLPTYYGEECVKKQYNKIADKYALTYSLLALLEEDKVEAKERILNFVHALKAMEKRLNLHRDPAWKNYTKCCFIALSILATGLIPGLLVLMAYSLAKGKSALFFAESQGEQFRKSAEKTVPTAGL
jgi:hypothetical protein